MGVIMAIVQRLLLNIVRNRGSWMFMILLPVAFTFVFGVVPRMGGNTLPVAVVDQDHTALSKAVVQQLGTDSDIRVVPATTAEVPSMLREMKVSWLISIPEGFQSAALGSQPLKIGWTMSPNGASGSDAAVATGLQQSFQQWMMFGRERAQTAAAQGQSKRAQVQAFRQGMRQAEQIHPSVSVQTKDVTPGRHPLSAGAQSAIGFSVMFIVFTVFSSAAGLLQERLRGTWQRMRASPVARGQIVAGYGLGFFIVGWIQYLILTLASHWLFHVDVPWNAWVALVVSLYVLATCGIALCIANLVKSVEQQMAIGSFFAIGSSMIGGVYWPLDIEPNWMQQVASFVPQSWTMRAFEQVTSGVVTSAVWLPLGILAAFAVVFYTAGIIQMRYTV